MEATGITLFGKKITCYDSGKFTNLPVSTTTAAAGFDTREHSEEDQLRKKTQEDGNPNTPTAEDVDPDTTKTETESDATNSQLNCLKKPDKILPCPRCKSMDTKFCYYNNYNVKQPRHFCKSCQRYWTAGGTMRTMPVGAGRRRNKTPISHCRFETIYQEAFHSAQIQVSNGVPSVPSKFLSFGLDLAHVDSVVSCRDKENGDECSSGSTVTTSNSVTEKSLDRNGFHSQVPCISPGVSWSYNPWNSAIPIPSILPAGYTPMPMAIYPSPYWNYIPSWLPISSPTQNDINLSVLGKHSPEPELIKLNSSEEPKKQKNSVLIPKTCRIDEAADSSIWSTLEIKNDNISTQGLFKAFQTKGEENTKHPVSTTSPVLQANPATLSRLFCFQERA